LGPIARRGQDKKSPALEFPAREGLSYWFQRN